MLQNYKEEGMNKSEKMKGFFGKLMDKLDKKMEEKGKEKHLATHAHLGRTLSG